MRDSVDPYPSVGTITGKPERNQKETRKKPKLLGESSSFSSLPLALHRPGMTRLDDQILYKDVKLSHIE